MSRKIELSKDQIIQMIANGCVSYYGLPKGTWVNIRFNLKELEDGKIALSGAVVIALDKSPYEEI
jgi:hypothetical protein